MNPYPVHFKPALNVITKNNNNNNTFFLFTPNVCMAACMNNSKNSYKNICLNVGIMLASLMYFYSNY